MIKRIVSLCLSLLLVGMVFPTANAAELPDLSRTDCSTTLEIYHSGSPVSGGTLCAVRVGTASLEDGDFVFRRIPDGRILNQIDSASAAAELEAFVTSHSSTFPFEVKTLPVLNGKAEFSELSTGLYLFYQKTPAPGFSPLNSFLVSMPYFQDGTYHYALTASAKTELYQEPQPTTPASAPPAEKLPQTGQLKWPVLPLATAGILLLILGFWLSCKKKPKNF